MSGRYGSGTKKPAAKPKKVTAQAIVDYLKKTDKNFQEMWKDVQMRGDLKTDAERFAKEAGEHGHTVEYAAGRMQDMMKEWGE